MIIKSTDRSKTLHKIGDHYNDFWFYTIKLFVDIDRDIHKVKLKNALKTKKTTWVFFFYKYGKF